MSARVPASSAKRVLDAFHHAGEPLTLAQIARRAGMHENGARRVLGRLHDEGRVVIEPGRPAGGRGRPPLRYRSVAAPETPFAELLPLVLRLLDGAEPPGRDGAYEAGRRRGREWGSIDEEPTGALLAAFTALGFAPRIAGEIGGKGVEVELTACPFASMVPQPGGGALCTLHHGIAAGIAERCGARVESFEIVDPRFANCRLGVVPSASAPS